MFQRIDHLITFFKKIIKSPEKHDGCMLKANEHIISMLLVTGEENTTREESGSVGGQRARKHLRPD